MTGRLAGKTAFITAAGAGIGAETAKAFLEEGGRVIATDLRADSLKGLAGAECHALDVRATQAVDAMAKRVGPVDILFNCAGFVHHGNALDTIGGGLGLFVRPQRDVDVPHHKGLSARHAGEGRRIDRQCRVGGLVDQGPAEPLCLWRVEGGCHRTDESGRGRFHHARHPLQCDRSGNGAEPVARRAHRRNLRRSTGRARRRRATSSSSVSRWDGLARRARSRCSRSISRRTKAPSPPASAIWPMAAWRCERKPRRKSCLRRSVGGRNRTEGLKPLNGLPARRARKSRLLASATRVLRDTTSIRTGATPELRMPSTPAAPVDTSMMRPRMNGPRSLIVTTACAGWKDWLHAHACRKEGNGGRPSNVRHDRRSRCGRGHRNMRPCRSWHRLQRKTSTQQTQRHKQQTSSMVHSKGPLRGENGANEWMRGTKGRHGLPPHGHVSAERGTATFVPVCFAII